VTLAEKVGRVALKCVGNGLEIQHQKAIEQLGKDIIEGLLKRGIYVNEAKGDPSGRW
jgi:hypothetical protein